MAEAGTATSGILQSYGKIMKLAFLRAVPVSKNSSTYYDWRLSISSTVKRVVVRLVKEQVLE